MCVSVKTLRIAYLNVCLYHIGDDDHVEIKKYLSKLSKYQVTELGLHLGLSYRWLSDRERSESYRNDVVDAWLKRQDNVLKVCPPTWRNLVEALRKVKQNGIASEILADKCVNTL